MQAAARLAIRGGKALALLVETAKQLVLGQAAGIHVRNTGRLRRERHEIVAHQRRNRRAVTRGMDAGLAVNLLSHRDCDIFHGSTVSQYPGPIRLMDARKQGSKIT